MSDLLWLTEAQMERLKPFFPLSQGSVAQIPWGIHLVNPV